MNLEKAEWAFSYEVFRMKMLEAKKAGVPIQPPVRPVFQNPECLELLGGLQFHQDDDTYKRLLKSEAEGPAPSGFAHPL
jgi:hypothetical protein